MNADRPYRTHPARRPRITHLPTMAIDEHRGRLLELAELRALAEMMNENGMSFDDFIEALRDRERVTIRETHVKASQGPQGGRSRDEVRLYPIVE